MGEGVNVNKVLLFYQVDGPRVYVAKDLLKPMKADSFT